MSEGGQALGHPQIDGGCERWPGQDRWQHQVRQRGRVILARVPDKFRKMLIDEASTRQHAPPHVHQLNGVAERAVRSVMEQVRVNLVAINLPVSVWA